MAHIRRVFDVIPTVRLILNSRLHSELLLTKKKQTLNGFTVGWKSRKWNDQVKRQEGGAREVCVCV